MDPDVALEIAEDDLYGVIEVRLEHAYALYGWLRLGGFMPARYGNRERQWALTYVARLIGKLEQEAAEEEA